MQSGLDKLVACRGTGNGSDGCDLVFIILFGPHEEEYYLGRHFKCTSQVENSQKLKIRNTKPPRVMSHRFVVDDTCVTVTTDVSFLEVSFSSMPFTFIGFLHPASTSFTETEPEQNKQFLATSSPRARSSKQQDLDLQTKLW